MPKGSLSILGLIKKALMGDPEQKKADKEAAAARRKSRIRNKLCRELRRKRNTHKGVTPSPKVMRGGKIKNRLSGAQKRKRKVKMFKGARNG